MTIPILRNSFGTRPSAKRDPKAREIRIGIPRVLNQWSTPRFWTAFFRELGVKPRDIVFSSDTSETQQREFGQGRGTVDCCYPVKCLTGHYGELLTGLKKPIDVLFSPKVVSLPSFLHGTVVDSLACPRVMAGPEMARAGFQREGDRFVELNVTHLSPIVNLAEPKLAARQLFNALQPVFLDLTEREANEAVEAALKAQKAFDAEMRAKARAILEDCAAKGKPCILAIGRPYHMDTGIGHDIEGELQSFGFPVVWGQYLPLDEDFLDRYLGADVRAGRISSPLDISDVWKSSYSANTNELIWAARLGSRIPEIACTIRFLSYECGMDQPTLTPAQSITEASGTLFFAFGDLDATKPAGSVRIRVETIAHYLRDRAAGITERKRQFLEELNAEA